MRQGKSLWIGLGVALFIGQAVLQRGVVYDKWAKNYAPESMGAAQGLAPDQLLFALAGFREMVAGILWVRADSFFDSGNYDGVLPIIRLVTLLDPHQLDVFATGMWHIGYNFTDEDQRSDRRYIPYALALGKEGARKNPETFELFFETGWMWYHKVDDDYEQAVKWFEEAVKRPDIMPARRNLLNKAYERAGRIYDSVNYYYELHEIAEKAYAENPEWGTRNQRNTVASNLDNTLVRMVQRGWIAGQNGTFEQGDYDTRPPFDVNFSVKVAVVEPRVLQIDGTWGVLPVGTRIRIVLRDKDYPGATYASLDWDGADEVRLDPPAERTYMQDQLYVRNRRFVRKIDMSRDPTMYPFTADHYVLEFYYNPRSAPPHIQDRFGYDGEGMTDQNFLRTDVRESQRVIYTSFDLSKDQILRRGDWVEGSGRTPIVKTGNYVEIGTQSTTEEIIQVPALRGN